MRSKLAGRLQLSDMISQHLDQTREKIAAAESDESEKAKKVLKHEKKEHGHMPSVKEEEAEHEKKASFDPHDPDHIEKLASALDDVGEKLAGDSAFIGGESTQGGMVLPTMGRVPGKQSTTVGKAKHQVPNGTGLKATKDNPGAATAVPTDDDRAPGGTGAKYPAKGVLKTAGQSVRERIEAAKAKALGEDEAEVEEAGEEKKAGAEAVDFILGKIAESTQGGETLDSKSGEGPKPPSQPGRQLISNNAAPAKATKREAKSARKAELKQVLTEPAQTKATDKVVSENLRNADKGGVKIAAVRTLLQKIAEEGCTCGGASSCRNCKLKTAVAAKKAAK